MKTRALRWHSDSMGFYSESKQISTLMKVLGRELWQIVFSEDDPNNKSLVLQILFSLSS